MVQQNEHAKMVHGMVEVVVLQMDAHHAYPHHRCDQVNHENQKMYPLDQCDQKADNLDHYYHHRYHQEIV